MRVKNGESYEKNGWIYVSIKGSPYSRGYAYGKLIAAEMKRVNKIIRTIIYNDFGVKWDFFIRGCTKYIKPTIMQHFGEFYEEMVGFSKGCTHGGTPMSIDEVVAWNNYFTLTESWFGNMPDEEARLVRSSSASGHQSLSREGGGSQERCSAFIANGKYTKDGKIVMAHNNFSNFADGQLARVVVDMNPTHGHRFIMLGFPGWIWSGTDFFVTAKGIMGCETTIGGFFPYENKFPISCRIRQAMQYGNSLDEYVSILLHENSGDYANSWMFGDIHTNEILRLELGLKYHKTDRTKNGYYIGFNAAYDPRIRNLECVNSGFDDIRRHQGARRVRLDDLMQEYKGKLDTEAAKRILGDHYDVYLNKENPCSRTICAHYEMDAREYMSQSDRPKPYQPRGALDGNVCDSTMAKNMSLWLRWGNSCGIPFYKDKFCDEHREWNYLRPLLEDRVQQPWTLFKTSSRASAHSKQKTKRSSIRKHSKTKKH
jgi:hypothetical protein